MQLRAKRLGFCIGDLYLGCVMSADDLILMSSSLTVLQKQCYNACVSEATSELDMSSNAKKSTIIRVSRGYNKNLAIASKSRVSCAHNTSRAFIGLITPRPLNLG